MVEPPGHDEGVKGESHLGEAQGEQRYHDDEPCRTNNWVKAQGEPQGHGEPGEMKAQGEPHGHDEPGDEVKGESHWGEAQGHDEPGEVKGETAWARRLRRRANQAELVSEFLAWDRDSETNQSG
jgi:hypothetical protein